MSKGGRTLKIESRGKEMEKRPLKVAGIIPAHNEEENIRESVECLVGQTYPIERIVAVNDASTDGTERELKELSRKYPQVTYVSNEISRFRAGAVNRGLRLIWESEDEFDFIIIIDADTLLEPHVLEEAIEMLQSDSSIGGVCSISALRPGKGLLYRLQKLEYGSFTAFRTETWRNVMILHGLCSVFRADLLKEIGGYTEGVLLEDYDLTLKIKEVGKKTCFNPRMQTRTTPVKTWRQLIRQRIRWFRGGIEVILRHGLNRFTGEDVIHHILFILLFLVVTAIVGLSIANYSRWTPYPYWHPIPIILAVLGYVDGLWRLRWVKDRDWVDILIRITLLPELLYYTFLSYLRLYCYGLVLVRAKRKW